MRTPEHSHIPARRVAPLVLQTQDIGNYADLSRIGIGLDESTVRRMMAGVGMDAMPGTVTTASITTPVQFLQAWLPGFVQIMTAARKIDEFVGVTTAGSWEDEEVVQGVMEVTGTSQPYGDYTNIPLSSWNVNFERRSIVRFEEGMRVGVLEEARAAKIKANSAESKREGASLALEIQRNRIGFYGYNNGANRTYGFLNDPSLPAYVDVATGAGGDTTWASKTFLEITADIRAMTAALRSQSGDLISAQDVNTTLGLATDVVEYLSVTSDYGISVQDWLTKTYPKMRVVSAPELNGANGAENVAYLYAETVPGSSSDGGRVFDHIVPSKFQVIGVAKQAKGYEEDYSNATAGIFLKRPFAVVRRSGL